MVWSVLAGVMLLLWWRQTRTRNANAVDAAWALGFSVVPLVFAVRAPNFTARTVLVSLVILTWSWRLGFHLLRGRVLGKKPEDARYRALRGRWRQGHFFVFYQAQAFLIAMLSVPMLAALSSRATFSPFDLLAAGFGFLAVAGEAFADHQLARHQADPGRRARTCDTGLWRYSRHPNYFFEWLHWWAYVFFAMPTVLAFPALIGPVVMAWFLLKITGIPAAEAQSLQSRPDYAAYRARTSAFVPWFPRR